jgi:hypothetical protein
VLVVIGRETDRQTDSVIVVRGLLSFVEGMRGRVIAAGKKTLYILCVCVYIYICVCVYISVVYIYVYISVVCMYVCMYGQLS